MTRVKGPDNGKAIASFVLSRSMIEDQRLQGNGDNSPESITHLCSHLLQVW